MKNNRALIVVDVQKEYFNGPLEIMYPSHRDSLKNITHAIDVAKKQNIPIVVFQHSLGEGAPVFDPSMPQFELHPEIERRRTSDWKCVIKKYSSVFGDTDLLSWLHEREIDTITFIGYMTNNCITASSAHAEIYNLKVEVLSDATGAIHLANDAGQVDAKTVHTTLMALLNSNWAAVTSTENWGDVITKDNFLEKSNLVLSAITGAKLKTK